MACCLRADIVVLLGILAGLWILGFVLDGLLAFGLETPWRVDII